MRGKRSAYTLLEMLLAAAIAILILYGLYVAMDVMIVSAQAGREVVEEATLTRSLLTRMTNDLTPAIGVPDPGRYKESDGGSAAEEGTEEVPIDAPVGPIYHMVGAPDSLTVFVSRVPRELYRNPGEMDASGGNLPIYSDQRRITYFMTERGLARQETLLVTTTSANGTDLALSEATDEGTHIVAPEVREMAFRYWDGEAWQDTWDGASTAIDGKTPLGSPMAVEVRLLVVITPRMLGAEPRVVECRHVIAIPSANGLPQQPPVDATQQGTMQQGTTQNGQQANP